MIACDNWQGCLNYVYQESLKIKPAYLRPSLPLMALRLQKKCDSGKCPQHKEKST